MRWSFLLAVFGLSVANVASFAQRPPGDQRPATTRSASHDNGFFASKGVVRFELIQGRLCLDEPRHRKGSQQRDENDVFESITVTADRGIPSLHYVHKSPAQHLTLSVQQGRSMRLESLLVSQHERSTLIQPAGQPIEWTMYRGDIQDQYVGTTLLHVRHADEIGFDTHFGELIACLLRGDSLRSISESVSAVASNQPASPDGPTTAEVARLVEQFGSSRRSDRTAAERKLLGWGATVIPLLSSIPARDLDTEQRARLDRIISQLRPREADTPASLAMLLGSDRSYWLARANQLTGDQLATANLRLQQMGVEPIPAATGPLERIAAASE